MLRAGHENEGMSVYSVLLSVSEIEIHDVETPSFAQGLSTLHFCIEATVE